MPETLLTTPAAQAAPKPVSLILRILSGIGGVVVFLLGLLFSVGAILAAPLGIWFVQRWRRRHDRRPSRIASLFGAITGSSLFTVLVGGAIFALGSHPTQEELSIGISDPGLGRRNGLRRQEFWRARGTVR